jgi:hypothetical protein
MAALLAAVALAVLVQAPSPAEGICYDLAVVGHIQHADNFVGLDHFVPARPSVLVLGGRSDVDIRVDQVLTGPRVLTAIKARVVLTDMISPRARLLILLARGPVDPDKDDTVQEWNGRFIPRASAAIPWRVVLVEGWRGRFDRGDPSFPRRCS